MKGHHPELNLQLNWMEKYPGPDIVRINGAWDPFLHSMGGGALLFLVGGVVYLVNCVNWQGLNQLNSQTILELWLNSLRDLKFNQSQEDNNRSVMSFDVLGFTRTTLSDSASHILSLKFRVIFWKCHVKGICHCSYCPWMKNS